ncbi:YL1 nuclear protein-domain-containing protein [Rhizoctonia solani]|nr:YL1 nuclear protein-domain-containing protein [Rhizoctonia solani]
MSLSTTRSRRSNAGNRWAEALAAVQLESGDAPDLDAEAPGEEFVGKEEEDVFESDFESTDEEEYAKQGVDDGEKQVEMEEKAERRAARSKASKIGSAPAQKILERAIKGQPAPKKKRTLIKSATERKPSLLWDATRQSERSSTVKHKFQVQERLKDAEKRKAHAPKRPRPVAPTKTQDELIAAALELEEKNTKALREFLQKEEEKRAAARRVVRLKIEGPVVRWVSRGEVPLVEEIEPERVSNETLVVSSQAEVQAPTAQIPAFQAPVHPAPVSQAPIAQVPIVREVPPSAGVTPSPIVPAPSSTPVPTPTPAPARASTPSRTQRMQVYVELPTPSKSMRRSLSSSSTQGSPLVSRGQEGSPPPLIPRGLGVPSSQPLVRSPLSSTVSLPKSPLSTFEPLVPEAGYFQSMEKSQKLESSQPPESTPFHSLEPTSSQYQEPRAHTSDPPRIPHPPEAIRQSSIGSSSSSKSKGKMVMYVEIPVRKRDRSGTPGLGSVGAVAQSSGGLFLEPSPAPSLSTFVMPEAVAPPVSTPAFSSPAGPRSAAAPRPTPASPSHKQARNYVIVEYGGGARASFGWNMQAIFGNHADWEDVLIHGIKPPHPVKPICAITGLSAPYRDSRTGIPYANAYAYKTLTRLLAHEFIWSKERGCYVGDAGKIQREVCQLGGEMQPLDGSDVLDDLTH